jgi:hypothetical protein
LWKKGTQPFLKKNFLKNDKCLVHCKLFPRLFGKQDLIQEVVRTILKIENLTDESKSKCYSGKFYKQGNELLNHFSMYLISLGSPVIEVIYLYHKILTMVSLQFREPQYNPLDLYLISNSKLLKDFCYWNLSLLKKRNPNAPHSK